MKISDDALKILKQFEKLSLKSYPDGGKLSIGYGHQIKPDEIHLINQTITQTHAEILLKSDLKRFEDYVNKFSEFINNQHQFDALVIFAFNVGSFGVNFQKHLKSKDHSKLFEVWRTYNKSQGKIFQGLIIRREKEIELFKSSKISFEASKLLPFFFLPLLLIR